MREITVNLHNHSFFSSGGEKYHALAQAGLSRNIDVIIVTDHNVYVSGKEQYYYRDDRKTLILTGEEIFRTFPNDQGHLLVLNGNRELANLADTPQQLINVCNQAGAITILAHPFDLASPWKDWEIRNFTGIEILNLQSSYYEILSAANRPSLGFFQGVSGADDIVHAPLEAIQKWDELLTAGKQVAAYCGAACGAGRHEPSDASTKIYQPDHLFAAANNHVYVDDDFGTALDRDREIVYRALRLGKSYLAMDIFQSPKGFVFKADTINGVVYPGDRVSVKNGATIKIEIPAKAVCRLIHQGKVYREWENARSIPLNVNQPGYYRVEVYLPYKYQLRGWIYTNPIYFY